MPKTQMIYIMKIDFEILIDPKITRKVSNRRKSWERFFATQQQNVCVHAEALARLAERQRRVSLW